MINSINSKLPVVSPEILSIEIVKAEPSRLNTMVTVVEVGKPRVLKILRRMTSEIIAVRQIIITSLKEK